MTLYQVYKRYQKVRGEIEDDFRERIREAGTPAPEILMEISREFRENEAISTFVLYTHKHPLSVHQLLKFMSQASNQKWSCSAKLTPQIPEHIKEDLEHADELGDPHLKIVSNEILKDMEKETFFEIIFHTTHIDKNSQTETKLAIPFTISTCTPYKELKKNPNLLEDINFYECLFDGIFQSSNVLWTICPHREINNFVPNVVANYMKTVKIGENSSEKEKDL